jgi:Deoxyxylulose-5-phosphate synthase
VITGGFGDGVSSWLLENDFQGQIKRLGLPDSFYSTWQARRIIR